MSTNYWCELNDNQAETVAGGILGTPDGFTIGGSYARTYYSPDGTVTSSEGDSYFDDYYPDGVLDYKDALGAAAARGYVLKQTVLKNPSAHFQRIDTTRTEKYVYYDGSYSITEYTNYNFGFEYVTQGKSKAIL